MKQKMLICFICAVVLSGCTKPDLLKKNEITQPITEKVSLKELLNKSESMKCTTSSAVDVGMQEVTYYIDGATKRMRMNVKRETKGDEATRIVESSMIMDKNVLYSWNSQQPNTGLKFEMDLTAPEKTEETKTSEVKNNNIDIDSKVDVKCEKWNIDNSLFTLPSGVEFTDLSKFMINSR